MHSKSVIYGNAARKLLVLETFGTLKQLSVQKLFGLKRITSEANALVSEETN